MSKCPFHRLTAIFGMKPEGKPDHAEWFASVDQEQVSLAVEMNADFQAQIRMIELSEQDLKLLKKLKPLVAEHIEDITSAFYRTVLGVDKLKEIIERHSTVERLRQTLKEHLLEMFNGTIDESFIQKRMTIAKVHERIGLEPKWYMGAFQNLQSAFLEKVSEHSVSKEEALLLGKVITKLLNLEQQLVLDAYEKENIRHKAEQNERIKEMLKGSILAVSEELAALSQQTSASVEQLVSSSSDVNRSFLHSVGKSKEAQAFADQGQAGIVQLSERIRTIAESTRQMEATVGELSASSSQIRGIVSLVQEIAGQTKLLSLNASIEAARAGVHGAGFSVVAQEVQKLSEDTRQAVERITGLIDHSYQLTNGVVRSIHDVQQLVDDGQAKSDETSRIFEQITASMDSSIGEIGRVEKDMQELVSVIEEIGLSISKVALTAENLNETTHNI